MGKRITIIYCTILFLSVFSSIIILCTVHNTPYSKYTDNTVLCWNDIVDKEDNSDKIVYTTILPDDISDKIIAFNSLHSSVNVFIDGNLIYTLKPLKNSFIKTTGTTWNYVLLHDDYRGKPLKIEISSVYGTKLNDSNIYFGQQTAITRYIIESNIVVLAVASIIYITGIIMFVYSIITHNFKQNEHSIVHFSVFAITLGSWLLTNCNAVGLIPSLSIANVFIEHLNLMIMPVPFILFFKDLYNIFETKLIYIYCYFNCFVILFRIIMQILGLYDFKETLWITHISIILFISVTLFVVIHQKVLKRITRNMRINIIAIVIILFSTLVDLYTYITTGTSSTYGAFGFFIYTIFTGVNLVKQTNRMIENAKEAELYQKLAFTDELTGLYNRNAFNEDLTVLEHKSEVSSTENTQQNRAIFMFDLNDLKKCNDNFGHKFGDEYIAKASSAIAEIFAKDGKCYRIGGDEFCVITPFTSELELKLKCDSFEHIIDEIRKKPFVVPFFVAYGYAIFDKDIDKSLADTQRRADAMMYQNKMKSKNKASEN